MATSLAVRLASASTVDKNASLNPVVAAPTASAVPVPAAADAPALVSIPGFRLLLVAVSSWATSSPPELAVENNRGIAGSDARPGANGRDSLIAQLLHERHRQAFGHVMPDFCLFFIWIAILLIAHRRRHQPAIELYLARSNRKVVDNDEIRLGQRAIGGHGRLNFGPCAAAEERQRQAGKNETR